MGAGTKRKAWAKRTFNPKEVKTALRIKTQWVVVPGNVAKSVATLLPFLLGSSLFSVEWHRGKRQAAEIGG